eukprot:TRINITY_DN3044_c0_g1_i1.p6 TRINITY_DN3044_c0_g1~~TRINITY_DN3044_c0_g1_i1.p6  ORF type:complete len:449 (+),score=95.49 TRINITY_DN3044_c0_g1_i1:101-1348(+)
MEQGEHMCEVHVESKASFYCTTPGCEKFICAQCVATAHKDHSTYFTRFVSESAKGKIISELEKVSKKKAKNLETTEKLLSGPPTSIKGELEDIVFNSKYITLLRQKMKEYEKHNLDLTELNKQLMGEKKKMWEDSMKESGKYQQEVKEKMEHVAELQKKLTDETKRFEGQIQTLKEEREKDMLDLKEMHRIELEGLVKEKRELEEELKNLKEYKEHKVRKEIELKECKDQIERLKKDFTKERMELADLHMKKINSLKSQKEADEVLEKNKARLLAQKDLAITEETHKRLVEDLQIDRKTQKDEIERIKRKEDKLSKYVCQHKTIGRDYKEVVRDLELTQQRLESKTKRQAILEKKIKQYEEELKIQKESLTQVVKEFEKEKELMKHHYEGELNRLKREIQSQLVRQQNKQPCLSN